MSSPSFEDRLTVFYQKYNPREIPSIPPLTKLYRDKQDQDSLMANLVKKYGPEPVPPPPLTASERLAAILKEHGRDPIEKYLLLAKFKEREDELFDMLLHFEHRKVDHLLGKTSSHHSTMKEEKKMSEQMMVTHNNDGAKQQGKEEQSSLSAKKVDAVSSVMMTPLPDFVGIKGFSSSSSSASASSSTTTTSAFASPHRTILRPVFIQRIQYFGSMGIKHPCVFKSVCAVWEETMNNYTDISVCWKRLLFNQDHPSLDVLTKQFSRYLEQRLCALKDQETRTEYFTNSNNNNIDNDSSTAAADKLILVAMKARVPFSSRKEVKEHIALHGDALYKAATITVNNCAAHYHSTTLRTEFSPAVFVMLLRSFFFLVSESWEVKNALLSMWVDKVFMTNLKNERLGDQKDPQWTRAQPLFASLMSAVVTSPEVSKLEYDEAEIDDKDEAAEEGDRKLTNFSQRIVCAFSSRVALGAKYDTLGSDALVHYLNGVKILFSPRDDDEDNNSNNKSTKNRNTTEEYHERLIKYFHSGNEIGFNPKKQHLFLPVLLRYCSDNKIIEEYLKFIENEGATESLKAALDENFFDELFLSPFIDVNRLNLALSFLSSKKKNNNGNDDSSRRDDTNDDDDDSLLLRRLLDISPETTNNEKTTTSSSSSDREREDESRRKRRINTHLLRLCKCNSKSADEVLTFFVDPLQKMNLWDKVIYGALDAMRSSESPVNEILKSEKLSSESRVHFLKNFFGDGNNNVDNNNNSNDNDEKKAATVKMLESTNVLDAVRYWTGAEPVKVICDILCEYGIFDQEYRRVHSDFKTDELLASYGVSRYHHKFWRLEKVERKLEEKDARIASLEEENIRMRKENTKMKDEIALIKEKLGM